MRRHNRTQERDQQQSALRSFYEKWKPTIVSHATTIVVVACGLALAYTAWYYVMAFNLVAAALAAVVAYIVGASLSETLVAELAMWSARRRQERERRRAEEAMEEIPATYSQPSPMVPSPA